MKMTFRVSKFRMYKNDFWILKSVSKCVKMAEWDFKIFVECELKLIGCRKQLPEKKIETHKAEWWAKTRRNEPKAQLFNGLVYNESKTRSSDIIEAREVLGSVSLIVPRTSKLTKITTEERREEASFLFWLRRNGYSIKLHRCAQES